ncbi:MAG TPA: LLM class flavin-dependent oxidoreductase [Amycolatopsis sp.]|nr:LLM class flavin-dependent oxidoreductase [Amycolatopsis sp.]
MFQIWRIGAWPVPVHTTGELARELEAIGWDGFAVGEAAGAGPDPYVCLTLAARATSRIRLGTGVIVPVRDPQLAAKAMASVHAVSGGRTLFSLGRGDGAMKFLGRQPLKVDDHQGLGHHPCAVLRARGHIAGGNRARKHERHTYRPGRHPAREESVVHANDEWTRPWCSAIPESR